ncbi:MAG: response regulator transcription factor [Ferruginibacter sp.]
MKEAVNKTHSSIIRIVVIEDDETIRNGYHFLLDKIQDFFVVNTYASFEAAALHIAMDAPHIILLDIELPGINGINAIQKLNELSDGAGIIMLTVYEDPAFIFESLGNGAKGYLTKNTSPEKIVEAIRDTIYGGGPLSAAVARIVIQSFQKNEHSPLTKRESEILQSIADGKSRSRISEELFINLETVRTHIKNLYQKLNVHSRADAIKAAKENRFIR